MRGLAISMTREGARLWSTGWVYSRVRLQLSAAAFGRSTMLCSGLACITKASNSVGEMPSRQPSGLFAAQYSVFINSCCTCCGCRRNKTQIMRKWPNMQGRAEEVPYFVRLALASSHQMNNKQDLDVMLRGEETSQWHQQVISAQTCARPL